MANVKDTIQSYDNHFINMEMKIRAALDDGFHKKLDNAIA